MLQPRYQSFSAAQRRGRQEDTPQNLMLKLTDLLKDHKKGLRLNPSSDSSPPKLPLLACYPLRQDSGGFSILLTHQDGGLDNPGGIMCPSPPNRDF